MIEYLFLTNHNKSILEKVEEVIKIIKESRTNITYGIKIINDNEIQIILYFSYNSYIFILVESDNKNLYNYIINLFEEVSKDRTLINPFINIIIEDNNLLILTEENNCVITKEANGVIIKENLPILINLLNDLEDKIFLFHKNTNFVKTKLFNYLNGYKIKSARS